MIPIGLRSEFEFVPDAAGLGFDYLELPLARIAALTDREFDELTVYLGGAGVRPEVLYDMLPEDIRVNGPDVRARLQHDYLDHAFARARRLGAKVVAFDAARARAVPAGFDFSLARRQTGNFLRIVQGHAAQFGLKVAIENLRHGECNLISTVSEAAMIAALLQLSQIGVLANTVQMAYASEPLDAIERCGGDLIHVHVGNPISRALPKRGDGEDYARLFRILTHRGYAGRVGAVSTSECTVEGAREALLCLRAAREAALV